MDEASFPLVVEHVTDTSGFKVNAKRGRLVVNTTALGINRTASLHLVLQLGFIGTFEPVLFRGRCSLRSGSNVLLEMIFILKTLQIYTVCVLQY